MSDCLASTSKRPVQGSQLIGLFVWPLVHFSPAMSVVKVVPLGVVSHINYFGLLTHNTTPKLTRKHAKENGFYLRNQLK